MNREIPLIADEWAKPELGSGCVKITPAHDPNDYEVGKRQSLPMINILNPDGTLNDNAGTVQGPDDRQGPRARGGRSGRARPARATSKTARSSCRTRDRSKTPIEPYLADQWFVKMGDTRMAAWLRWRGCSKVRSRAAAPTLDSPNADGRRTTAA